MNPRYARREIERRWIADLGAAGPLAGARRRQVQDLYVTGTRMRLRLVTEAGQPPVYKLGRKEPAGEAGAEWMTNFYLSAQEHAVLAALPGCWLRKDRYAIEGGALDLHEEAGLPAIFEREFGSAEEAARYTPPAFVRHEVTGDLAFTGAALAARADATPGGAADVLRHRISAGVLAERDGRVLLVHCVREGAYDFWVAPGGGAQGTEDLRAAAQREALEECGLQVAPGRLAYIEEFHSPTTRFCKFWFLAEVTGGEIDVGHRLAQSEFIREAAFLSREQLAPHTVFPAVLKETYWDDRSRGAIEPRYLGIRAMDFW